MADFIPDVLKHLSLLFEKILHFEEHVVGFDIFSVQRSFNGGRGQ